MSPVSDQQWLRQIGVDVTADDEDAGISDDAVELDDEDAGAETGDEPAEFEDPSPDVGSEPGSDPQPDRAIAGLVDDGEPAGKDVRPRRYTPWVLGVFAAVAVVATVATTLGVTMSGPDAPPPRVHPSRPAPAPSLAAAPTAAPPDTEDRPLPFTARADCAGGSTSANSIADPERPSPWICVRHTDVDVLPAVKLRGFLVPSGCLVVHAASNAVGCSVVEVRAERLCRITALALRRALIRATDLREGGCLRPRRLRACALRLDFGDSSTS